MNEPLTSPFAVPGNYIANGAPMKSVPKAAFWAGSARARIDPYNIIAWSLWRPAHQAAAQRAHIKSKAQL